MSTDFTEESNLSVISPINSTSTTNSSGNKSSVINMDTKRYRAIRKNRRYIPRKRLLMPYFLLGGNKSDPLNLNALIQQKKEKTFHTDIVNPPKPNNNNSSDGGLTVEILLTPNTRDPLRLDGDSRSRNLSLSVTSDNKNVNPTGRCYYRQASQPYGKNKNLVTDSFIHPQNNRPVNTIRSHAQHISPSIRPLLSIQTSVPNSVNNHLNLYRPSLSFDNQYYNQTRSDSITTPSTNVQNMWPQLADEHEDDEVVKFREQGEEMCYGNFKGYYGYRDPSQDNRLTYMKSEWFKQKDVLDIGCHTGHVTFFIAENFNPKTILGVDIDQQLIHQARQRLWDKIQNHKRTKINNEQQSNRDIQFPLNMRFQQ
ncbi:unnamed protein product, partial [Didymodactylos carnosus]